MPTILTSSSLVDTLNSSVWTITPVTVALAGTPVQGPSLVNQFNNSILVHSPLSNLNKRLFVATSAANAAIANSRVELRSGESLVLKIDNANLLWFNASINATVAQIITEA